MALELFKNQGNELDINLKDLLSSDSDFAQSRSLFQNQDMVKLVETYLGEDIPEELKNNNIIKRFWAVLGKTIKLTFLDKDDIIDFEILYDQARINYIMSMPPYDFNFSDQETLDQMRIYFLAAVRRAVGTDQHRFNERIILGGSVNQVIRSNTESIRAGGGSGGGFLSKLKSMF